MRSRDERERDSQYFGDVTFGLGLCLWCRERPATHGGECEICWRLPGHRGGGAERAGQVMSSGLTNYARAELITKQLEIDSHENEALRAENERQRAALLAIWRITFDLTVQSRLSASGPGVQIAQIILDTLGVEALAKGQGE